MRYNIAQPWALDATGRELPTWFEGEGNVLRQFVDATGAESPVIFDPTYSNIDCLGHYSTLDAGTYMDVYPDDPAYCPVYGMLLATSGYMPE